MIDRDAASAILSCIRSKSYDPIEDFVKTLINIDETDELGYTLLRHAVGFAATRDWRSPGAVLVVKYLIQRGANVNCKNPMDTFYNLLCCAAFHGCIEIVKALRAAGQVTETPPGITPPLSHAQYEPLMMKYLIDIGCDPEYKDEHSTTILMKVAEKGLPASVFVLLSAGVNLGHVDTYGYTALRYAQGCDEDGHPYEYERRPLVCRLIRAEIARRAESAERMLAFAMAGNRRLGEDTRMKEFDPELINDILERVYHEERRPQRGIEQMMSI